MSYFEDLEALELCQQLDERYYSLSDDYLTSSCCDSANSSWNMSEDDLEMRSRGNRIDGKPSLNDIAKMEMSIFRKENEDSVSAVEVESPDTPSTMQEEN